MAKGRPSLSASGCRRLRELLVVRANQRCEACGAFRPLDRDHVLERGDGGSDTWQNNIMLCRECHKRKQVAYQSGRLLIEAHGDGTFTLRLATGSKHEQVVVHTWTAGRVPTETEQVALAALVAA